MMNVNQIFITQYFQSIEAPNVHANESKRARESQRVHAPRECVEVAVWHEVLDV